MRERLRGSMGATTLSIKGSWGVAFAGTSEVGRPLRSAHRVPDRPACSLEAPSGLDHDGRMNGQRLANLVVPLLVVLLFVGAPAAVTVYVDWLWYGEVGYREVFLGRVLAKALLGGFVAAAAFGLLFVNVRLALRGILGYELTVPAAEGVRTVVIEPRFLRRLGLLVAAAAAVLLGVVASLRWEAWLLYRHATPFGQADAVLGRDVSFYVFHLPFLQLAQGLLQTALLAAVVLSVVGYVVGGRLGLGLGPGGGPFADRGAVRHLGVLAALVFAVLGVGGLARDSRPAHRVVGDRARRFEHGRGGAHPRPAPAHGGRRRGSRARARPDHKGAVPAHRDRGGALRARGPGWARLRHPVRSVRGGPQRAGAGDPVHPPQHRGHAPGLRPRGGGRAGARRATPSSPARTSTATRRP